MQPPLHRLYPSQHFSTNSPPESPTLPHQLYLTEFTWPILPEYFHSTNLTSSILYNCKAAKVPPASQNANFSIKITGCLFLQNRYAYVTKAVQLCPRHTDNLVFTNNLKIETFAVDVRDAIGEKNGIMWEKFPNGRTPHPPSLGNPCYQKKSWVYFSF